MESDKVKTRHLSIFQFYEMLQSEYLVLELRSKIYPAISDKEYYKRVMEQKKEKILDIASKNYLPSIFDDPEIKNHKREEIYKPFGMPNFIYKDEEHKKRFAPLDKKYYYLPESEVRITVDGELRVGKIQSVDFHLNKAVIKCGEESVEMSLDHISRVL
jgi:hypothetical protein